MTTTEAIAMPEDSTRNEQLTQALENAGLTSATAAERLGVNVRSVQSWLAGNAIPRRDERMKLGLLLGISRSDLWPDIDDAHQLGAVAEWPNLPAVPKELWRKRFSEALDHINICAGSAQVLAESNPDLHDLLLAKRTVLNHDVTIRVVFSDPNGQASAKRDARETAAAENPLEPGGSIATGKLGLKLWSTILDGIPGAELRLIDHDDIWTRGVFRFDDSLLQYDYIGDQRGAQSRAVVDWRHVEPRGKFTEYMEHFEWCWERATPYTNDQ